MKKKFTLEISNPCEEDFSKMTENSNGSFCDSCAKNVIDLSTKSNYEISKFISDNKNNTSICARLKTNQLDQEYEFPEVYKTNNFKYAVAMAASVLIATNISAQDKPVIKTEINCPKPNPHTVGKVVYVQNVSKIISVVIEGKILDELTKKPLSNKKFPDIYLHINGAKNNVKVNPKTGAFSIPIMIDEKTTDLNFTLSSGNYYYSETINISSTKNIVKKDIFININQFSKMHMLGGFGINYVNEKRISNKKTI